MIGHKKATLATVAAILATAAGTALASTEQSNLAMFPKGYLTINPNTCKFLHKEIDQKTGPTWKNLRTYVVWEDARDDAKMSCLTNRPSKTTAPDKDTLQGYVQVTASGTGATVTATCPAGDVVLGGGSPAEFTASYPSSASSWTIGRDHLSPKVLVADATCATGAAS